MFRGVCRGLQFPRNSPKFPRNSGNVDSAKFWGVRTPPPGGGSGGGENPRKSHFLPKNDVYKCKNEIFGPGFRGQEFANKGGTRVLKKTSKIGRNSPRKSMVKSRTPRKKFGVGLQFSPGSPGGVSGGLRGVKREKCQKFPEISKNRKFRFFLMQ